MEFERVHQSKSRTSQRQPSAVPTQPRPATQQAAQSAHHLGHIPIEPLATSSSTPVQTKSKRDEQLLTLTGQRPNATGLPDRLKAEIENLAGFSLDNVKVHYNSDEPAKLQALAYTQGTDIHIAPGQERHLAHEAWHVVQQARSRVKPTMQLKGGVSVNDDEELEHEADTMGTKILQSSNSRSVQHIVPSLARPISSAGQAPIQAKRNVIGKDGKSKEVEDDYQLQAGERFAHLPTPNANMAFSISDIVRHIARFLSPADILSFGRTNKRIHAALAPTRARLGLLPRGPSITMQEAAKLTGAEAMALNRSKINAVSRIGSDRTKAIARFKQLGLIPPHDETLVDAAAALLNKSKLTINFKADKLDLLAKSKRVKTSWEVGGEKERDTTTPGHYGYKREVAETKILGYAPHSAETLSDLKTGKRYRGEKERIGRPKYAAVNFTNAHYGAASKYGTYHFILKDKVKGRSTFTGADTFRNIDDEGKPKEEGTGLADLSELVGTTENMYAVLATGRPEVAKRIGEMAALGNFMGRGEHYPSLAEVNETVYAEAQVHGSLGWEDIEAIGVPASELIQLEVDKNALKELNNALHRENETMQNVVWSTGKDRPSMNFLLGNPNLVNGMRAALARYHVSDIQHEIRPVLPKQARFVPFNSVLKVSVNKQQLNAVLSVAKEKKVGIHVVGTSETYGTWNTIAQEVIEIAKKNKVPLAV